MKAEGLSIKLQVAGEMRPFDRELWIDRSNLSTELAEQPSWYAYYSTLHVEASSQYDQVKGEYEKILAEVATELRTSYKKKGFKYTEKQLEAETIIDSRVQGMRRKVIDMKRRAEHMKMATKSMEQRLQALMSICALERVQMQNIEPSVRTNPSSSSFSNQQEVQVPSKDEYLKDLDEIRKRHEAQKEAFEMIGGKKK